MTIGNQTEAEIAALKAEVAMLREVLQRVSQHLPPMTKGYVKRRLEESYAG